MERASAEEPDAPVPQPGIRLLLPSREFLRSRKGLILIAEAVLSFIIFICYIASEAASFLMVPLLTLLLALGFFCAYSLKLNEKFKAIYWLLAVFGFIATVAYAISFYLTFNELMIFLKQGDSSDAPEPRKSEENYSNSDSDSD
ncbi:hypothetical protein lerEdw1_000936 [Lerista edwardsae]|nr:hypothetical protein lerEdw1_000936 [Lerista edwardsae]